MQEESYGSSTGSEMTPEPERRSAASRLRDQEIDRWRGQVTQQVRQLESARAEHNGDLRELRAEVKTLGTKVTTLEGQVVEARDDIKEAVGVLHEGQREQQAQRDEEVRKLERAIAASRVSGRDLLLHVATPLVLTMIGAAVSIVIVLLTVHK